MDRFIELLERKINGCDALGGLEREKAVYQSVLKDYKKQLNIGGVSSMLPSINSSTFKNYLEAKGYAETLNPLVYKKQGFEYDKEILHRHFLNEIEFGN